MKSGEKGTKAGQSSVGPLKPGVGPLFKVTQNTNNPNSGSVESGLELESQVVSTSL